MHRRAMAHFTASGPGGIDLAPAHSGAVAVPTLLAMFGLIALGPAPAAGQNSPAADETWRIGVIHDSDSPGTAAERGARLAADEAARAAQLVGRSFEVVLVEAENVDSAALAAESMISQGAFAIVGGDDEASCRALAEIASREGVLYLNTGCSADVLRGSECRRNSFHVAASETIRRNATGRTAGEVGLWHPDLYRYGATQLNNRFGERFEEGMSSAAWANWLAVKILWEAAVRADGTGADVLIEFLESSRAGFDGHKGTALSFRPWNHQLRQPIYLVHADGDGNVEIEELQDDEPAAGSGESPDPLGIPRAESSCRFDAQ